MMGFPMGRWVGSLSYEINTEVEIKPGPIRYCIKNSESDIYTIWLLGLFTS